MKISGVTMAVQRAAVGTKVKFDAALTNPSEITSFRRAFVYGMALALASTALDGGAMAAPTVATELANPMDNVSKFVCTVGNWLRGPIGLGVVILMIVVAGFGFATGGKKSTSVIIGALVGAAVIFGARAVAGMVTTTSAGSLGNCVA
jgi:type IV secretory pathway VirB2 component (pilin)